MIAFQKIVKLSPVISSQNIGDQIINYYCNKILDELFPMHMDVSIPTHEHLSTIGARHITSADYSFVCGTNLLCSDLKHNHQWNLNRLDISRIEYSLCKRKDFLRPWVLLKKKTASHVLLLGAGWFQYEGQPNHYTINLYKHILSATGIHSVRDSYTERKLRDIGVENVLNTSCPTMWSLTPEHCRKIPIHKANRVVTTLTDYHKDCGSDELMLDILLRNYDEVYVWLQAIEDYEYLKKMKAFNQVHIIAPNLSAYDEVLHNPDIEYVGTRLHGGIYALNAYKRTLIIATDNRALEISNDTGLPVIKRDEIETKLEELIINDRQTNIILSEENIAMWKNQFNRIDRGGQ